MEQLEWLANVEAERDRKVRDTAAVSKAALERAEGSEIREKERCDSCGGRTGLDEVCSTNEIGKDAN